MDIKDYSSRYNQLTGRFLHDMFSEADGENVVMSPFSILMLLGIAAKSTSGTTRDEIKEILGHDISLDEIIFMLCDLQSILSSDGSFISSNAVCINERLKESVNPAYTKELSNFRGELFSSNDIVDDINQYVKKYTRGMIRNIADDSIKDLMACLLNAVAFETQWQEPYDEECDIYSDVFHNSNRTESSVQMLCSTENYYIEDDNYTGFVRPYKDFEYSFMALLPKRRGQLYIERVLGCTDFTNLYKDLQHNNVNVRIPEFQYEYTKELKDLCIEMGISTIFSPEADFSPMLTERSRLDSIRHKARIEVDRKGTKAAAATIGLVVPGAAFSHEEYKTVYLDRPFVYAIMDDRTDLPVFVGVMNKAK